MWSMLSQMGDALRRGFVAGEKLVLSGLLTAVRVGKTSPARFVGQTALIISVALIGVTIGLLAGGRTDHHVGPFRADFAVVPATHGETDVELPPLGSLSLNSHDSPLQLRLRLGSLDPGRTKALVAQPNTFDVASETALEDLERGVIGAGFNALGAALLGALALGAVIFRNVRRVAWTGVAALVVIAGTVGLTVTTFRPSSIEEPRYQGLLANAPAVVGDARKIANQYDQYRAELQRLVRNVSQLYATVSKLPVYEPDAGTIRVLHISDLHLNPGAYDVVSTVVKQFGINVVVDTGDLTDWGSEPEANYTAPIGQLGVPYIFVRGNHDSPRTAQAVARFPNAVVLDGSVTKASGLTFAGIGDPRFTPDKSTNETPDSAVTAAGSRLADVIRAHPGGVDVAMVHDARAAIPVDGLVPVALAGHEHKRRVAPLSGNTLLMVEGSTGGAGLRGLQKDEPVPLELSVMYFGQDRVLRAYDDIRVGGAGLAEVTLQRRIVNGATPTKPQVTVTAPSGVVSPSPSQ